MKTRTIIQIIFLTIIGLILLLLLKWITIGIIVLSISTIILSGCLFIRGFSSRFERFTQFLIETFSLILSWIFLTPIYYLVFTPIRIILFIKKKDPLNRQFPTNQKSYWIPIEMKEIPDQYRKQF